jgi:DNA transposition AAA+ family ATPase
MLRPPAAQTVCMNEVFVAAHYAQKYGDISLIYGEAGLGKTFSLRQYAKENDVIYIELRDCDKSTKGVCERILDAIGKSRRGNDRVLVNAIIDYLREHPKLIIIDEAQHLLLKAIENLRAINDATETGMVLCGNPTVYDQMHGRGQAHFAQLYSRIGIRRCIVNPDMEDIKAIFSPYELNDDCLRFLHSLSLQWGGIRNCIKIFNMAQEMAQKLGEPLSVGHLETAHDLRNGNQ